MAAMSSHSNPQVRVSRRQFLRNGTRLAAVAGISGVAGMLASRSTSLATVWQIDPAKCLRCDRCATHCVLEQSAVKCVHGYALCGYCNLCTGYFEPEPNALNTAAENQLCPTAAIKRTFVEDPYYEYTIDEEFCIGCSKCVEGCNRFGNGSMFLQIRHDRCLNCNECAIAKVCPGDAFRRVPGRQPYLLKTAH
jgi:Na+-translocating ferredoxin:NAD+ oxidoreductase subunit B